VAAAPHGAAHHVALTDMSDEPTETGETGETGETPRRRRRRRRVWPWVLVVVAVIAVWAVAAGAVTLGAKRKADAGLSDIQRVSNQATGGIDQLVASLRPKDGEVDVTSMLHAAHDEFAAAADRLDSAILAPARVLPYVGRQLRSARALARAATTVSDATGSAYESLQSLLATSSTDPAHRLEAGQQAEVVLRRLQRRVQGLDLGPRTALYGSLARAHDRFASEYARLQDTTERAVTAVTGLNKFLTGPTTYLLLASNNGEMRAGSGMYLQVGTVTVQDGRFTISEMSPTRGLALPQPGATLDPDVAANWGWLKPNQEWRNLNVTPRYDESARMATEMWATQHPPVQGAINIDVAGLKSLLDVVGPVQVAGSTIDAANVEKFLLLDQYRDFGQDISLRPLRDERLALVAKLALEAFNTASWSPSDLLHSMLQAGRGRHLMLWTHDPVEQAAWRAVGASGEVPPDGLMLSSINRGGNKLDQFLRIDAQLTVGQGGGVPHMKLQVHIQNVAPPGLPRYVEGPSVPGLTQAGEYLGIVQLTMPGAATSATVTGGQLLLDGKDGPSQVIATQIRVLSGQSLDLEFDFALPKDTTTMELLPSARIPPTQWQVTGSGAPFTDAGPSRITFGRSN
jgi:hypothetical protein